METATRLRLLPRDQYRGVNDHDPIRLYYRPVLGPLYRRRVEMCLEECAGGEKILEVGFGTGLTFLNLKEMYREVHGLDLTADIADVKAVFDRHGVRTDLRNGDVLEMPYADGTFDTVLLISILEHIRPEQQVRAFSEARRVLRPGGQVVYGVPAERGMMVMAFRLLGVDIREHHFSTEDDVRKGAREAGLDEVRVKDLKGLKGVAGRVYQVGHFRKK